MKRVVPLILAVINVLGLVGCTGTFFTTAEYRTYQTFAEKHNAGMEKQTILNELGCPDGYYDMQGTYQSIPYADQESFQEILLTNLSIAWVYECWKRPDPADPYRLKITFDAEGASESAELVHVPGG